jgi:hypothetical protein
MPHLPKDESLSAQGPLQYTKCASLNPHINVWRNNIKVFQNLCWRCPAVFRSTLARLMCWRCSCIISFDVYVNNYEFLTMIINHGKWRRENSVIIKMFLNVHYISKIVIRGLTKSTSEILSIVLDTYFPNQKWKSTLVKEMMVSQCIMSTK